jgi:hypothetical protein
VRLREVRTQLKGAQVNPHRFIQPSLPVQCVAQVKIEAGLMRHDRQGPAQRCFRLGESFEPQKRPRLVCVRAGHVRDQFNRPSGAFQPLLKCTPFDQRAREVVVRHPMIRFERDGPAIAGDRVHGTAGIAQRVPIVQVGIR